VRQAGQLPGERRRLAAPCRGPAVLLLGFGLCSLAGCGEPSPSGDARDAGAATFEAGPAGTLHFRTPRLPELEPQRPLTQDEVARVAPYGDYTGLLREPLPAAPALSLADFEGVFPPKWRVGDTWYTVLLSVGIPSKPFHLDDEDDSPRWLGTVHRHAVTRIPDEPGAEYEIEIRSWQRHGSLSVVRFWPGDSSVVIVQIGAAGVHGANISHLQLPNGDHPFIDEETRWRREDVLAWPVVPAGLRNPLFYSVRRHVQDLDYKMYAGFQVVAGIDGGLRFVMRALTPHGVEEATCEFLRGDPWWRRASHGRRFGYLLAEEEAETAKSSMEFDWQKWLCEREPERCRPVPQPD
jgi:hypothetical protein